VLKRRTVIRCRKELMEMLKTQQRVHDMMEALGLPLPNEEGAGLADLNFDLMRALVREEAQEFDEAMDSLEKAIKSKSATDDLKERAARNSIVLHWWAEVIDAICDLTVVIHNTSNAMGVDIEPFFDEVHRTNMAKADGPTREDGPSDRVSESVLLGKVMAHSLFLEKEKLENGGVFSSDPKRAYGNELLTECASSVLLILRTLLGSRDGTLRIETSVVKRHHGDLLQASSEFLEEK
jgi:predicted HAD superfamily Cof-like phosphohydrolase